MTYGYDSVVAFSKSSAEVDDFARDLLQRVNGVRKTAQEKSRPLLFLCHSLGGILFKQVRTKTLGYMRIVADNLTGLESCPPRSQELPGNARKVQGSGFHGYSARGLRYCFLDFLRGQTSARCKLWYEDEQGPYRPSKKRFYFSGFAVKAIRSTEPIAPNFEFL
jgi:hypothetical protein